MAIPTINFKGFLYDDAGDAISGATVNLFAKNSTTTSLASDTTDSNGAWDINYTTAGTSGLDIQISSGDSKRRIKYDDKIHLAELDTALLNIRAIEAGNADMFFYADEGEDAGDRWRVRVADAGVMTFANDINTQGTYVAHVTITPNATVANSTFAIAGNLDVDGTANLDAVDIDGAVQIDAAFTSGVDGQGYDTKFFGDTSGAYMLWDTSADDLVFAGAAGIDLAGDIDVDGTANLDAVDIDGAVQIDNTVTVGVNDTGHDVKFFGASSGAYFIYDQSEDQVEIRGAAADATTSTGKLLLSTALTDINANDVIGKVSFQAPLEAGGTDAITVAASIEAVAQGTFSASVNATDLIFKTGHSEAATEKFRFTSQGEIGIGGANYGSSGEVLTSGGAGSAPSWQAATTGDITAVSLTGDSGGALSVGSGDAGFTVAGGNGITTSGSSTTITVALDAALTTVTSLLATDIKIGEDDQTKVDFETADEIHFYAANVHQVKLVDNAFTPQADSDVDLGASGTYWKDAFIDTITTTGDVDVLGNIELGHASDTTLARSAGGTVTIEGDVITTAGVMDMWIPAGAMRAASTNGCADITDVETTATRPDMQVLDFDSSTQEYAQFSIAMPKSWNEGTVTAQFYWTHATAVSTDVIWGIQGVCVSDNDTIDIAYGTAQTVTDTFHNAAEDLAISAATSAITLAGSPAEGDLAFFQVYRDADAAGDTTNSTDARLVGVKLMFTTNAANDA